MLIFKPKSSRSSKASGLRRGAIKLESGYLIGLFPDPSEASPCIDCVKMWLCDKGHKAEITESVSGVPKHLWELLEKEATPHLLLEIAQDLQGFVRMDTITMAHPECHCNKSNFISPNLDRENLQYTFTPVQQMKLSRYAIPQGSLWISQALGKKNITLSASLDREEGRYQAFQAYLAKTLLEQTSSKNCSLLTTGEKAEWSYLRESYLGTGADSETAVIEALKNYVTASVLGCSQRGLRIPTVITSTQNHLRERLPFFIHQKYDLHVLHFPTSYPTYIVGVLGIPRQQLSEPVLMAFASNESFMNALQQASLRFMEQVFPRIGTAAEEEENAFQKKMNIWWNSWVYRCPKLPLKSVPQEIFKKDLSVWKQYFEDGQTPIVISQIQSDNIPDSIVCVAKIQPAAANAEKEGATIFGIGTWGSFQKGLTVHT